MNLRVHFQQMANPEKATLPLAKICLLDFKPDDINKILSNKYLADRLTEFDQSSALSRIDELINLHEAPTAALLLNEKTVMEVRNEWTVEIPMELAGAIADFLEVNK